MKISHKCDGNFKYSGFYNTVLQIHINSIAERHLNKLMNQIFP
uniref:Uncharacterized protein n=1 Tax=Rhizophora mucronata TaxID=61149 RepID=A0A2P2MPJ2_RHIMU